MRMSSEHGKSMKSLARFAFLFSIATFGCLSNSTAAPASFIRASCTQKNVLVFKENVPRESLDQRRADIADRFPDAMCVFLEEPPEESFRIAEAPAVQMVNGVDSTLITALAAIQSKTSTDNVGEVIDTSFSQRFGDLQMKDTKSKVGLAIGIYDDVPLSTILAHWRSASSGTSWLAKMTPTFSTAGKITMLSLDGVKDDNVEGVCKEVEERGMKCLAAY